MIHIGIGLNPDEHNFSYISHTVIVENIIKYGQREAL